MSDIPNTNAGILAELLWWKWSDEYVREDWEPALERVLNEWESLDSLLDARRKEFHGTEQEWKHYRGKGLSSDIGDEFDVSKLKEVCHDKYYQVRAERYD